MSTQFSPEQVKKYGPRYPHGCTTKGSSMPSPVKVVKEFTHHFARLSVPKRAAWWLFHEPEHRDAFVAKYRDFILEERRDP